MVEFLFGFYMCGAIFTFILLFGSVMLGGKESELWIPFVYGALWPLVFIYALAQILRR